MNSDAARLPIIEFMIFTAQQILQWYATVHSPDWLSSQILWFQILQCQEQYQFYYCKSYNYNFINTIRITAFNN